MEHDVNIIISTSLERLKDIRFLWHETTKNYLTHGFDYYFKCMIGGAMSCGLTHTLMTPIDIVKCRKKTMYFYS